MTMRIYWQLSILMSGFDCISSYCLSECLSSFMFFLPDSIALPNRLKSSKYISPLQYKPRESHRDILSRCGMTWNMKGLIKI